MVAPVAHGVPIEAEKLRRGCKEQVALLLRFPDHGLTATFPEVDRAPRQVPARAIAVPDEKDPGRVIKRHQAHAEAELRAEQAGNADRGVAEACVGRTEDGRHDALRKKG